MVVGGMGRGGMRGGKGDGRGEGGDFADVAVWGEGEVERGGVVFGDVADAEGWGGGG